jgi:integrase
MMARRSTGGVVVDTRRKSAVFALRFRAYGQRQYVTLGSADDGWTRQKAEDALRHTLADVERGIWRPPDRGAAAPAPVLPEDPTFHEFASRWVADNEPGWRVKTQLDYTWQLTHHLLPFFANHRLAEITVQEVDRYRAMKVREGVLGATSINKTITRLAQILEVAVEYELIDRNPAKGKRRRVKAAKPAPVWLDRAEHISALVEAGGELDRRARRDRRHMLRRAMLATLVFAGLRIGELLNLRWRDVDLNGGGAHGCGQLHVRGQEDERSRRGVRVAKTDAGVRDVDVLPVLQGILAMVPRRGPDDLVFGTSRGRRQGASNVRRRVLAPAVAIADQRLEAAGEAPLPQPLTPHKLRHTFASVLVAMGCDPAYVMGQLGHADPGFTLRVYTHGMRRDPTSRETLRELVGAADWAATGSNVVFAPFTAQAVGSRR